MGNVVTATGPAAQDAVPIADLREVRLGQLADEPGYTEVIERALSVSDSESRVPVAMFNSGI